MRNISKKFLSIIILLLSQNLYASNDFSIYDIGKKKLKLPGGVSLSIVNFDKYEEGGHLNWKTKLVIKEDSKIILEKYPIIDIVENPETSSYFFVPINKNKYVMDLDQNKDFEFAIVIGGGGNAPSTRATVFSLKGSKLLVYKNAWYQEENGKEIIWNIEMTPKKCWFNQEKKCVTDI
jgi:hypothetical protein